MFWRRRKRLDEEIEIHLAHEAEDNIARGMNPEAARNAALQTFGNVSTVRETARELDPLYWLDTLQQDIRFAARLIGRNRWSSLAIVSTLTIGIALNVSIFSLLNGILLRPWVRAAPETFVSIVPRFSGQYQLVYSQYAGMSQPDYSMFRDSARSLESLAAFRPLGLTLSGSESGTIRGALVSCSLFDVIKPGSPILGRYPRAEECATPMQAPVAVLSEDLWRMRFDSDAGVLGRIIHLNRVPFTVIGVAPVFSLPGLDNEGGVWVPYTMLGSLRPSDQFFSDRRANWLTVIGRRKSGFSLPQIQEELNILARRADQELPGRKTLIFATDGSIVQDPGFRKRAPMIFAVTLGTATILLLLACVNVTTLLLSRSAARRREIAVRLSLGAGRFRLLRQLLTESFMLSGLAGALSFLIAQGGPSALWHFVVPQSAPFDLAPDGRALAYCLIVALVSGIVAGFSPAVESLRLQVAESLKGSSASATSGRSQSRLRGFLVATQIALSLVLLVEAGLFARSQRRFFSYNPGFEINQVLNVTFASVLSGFSPALSFYHELELRVAALPGVTGTSFVSVAPWSGRQSGFIRQVDGQSIAPPRDTPTRRVAPQYFSVLDIPITQGRNFNRNELTQESPVSPAIISEAMARLYWPDQNPVGRRFDANEVIGVARDVQSVRYMHDDGPFYYVPLDMQRSKPPALLIRTSGDTQVVAAAVREIIRQIDPQMAIGIGTLVSTVEQHGERLKPILIIGAFAGTLALFLALTGVYSVVSFSVSQRIREIGIRIALGAQRYDIISLVLRSGLAPVFGGLLVGIGLGLSASVVLESFTFGMSARDPLIFGGVALLLLLSALGAIWIPARRAASVAPVASLRQD